MTASTAMNLEKKFNPGIDQKEQERNIIRNYKLGKAL